VQCFGHDAGSVIDHLIEFEQLRSDILGSPVVKPDLVPPKGSSSIWIIGLSTDEFAEHGNREIAACPCSARKAGCRGISPRRWRRVRVLPYEIGRGPFVSAKEHLALVLPQRWRNPDRTDE